MDLSKGLMIDLSGTVHVGSTLLPGVQAAIHKASSFLLPMIDL
jgi:ribonucleotide monophosphatase NagD (HAD superfamily)